AREPAADDVVAAAGDGRVAEGPDAVADAHVVGVGQGDYRKVLAGDAQQGQVGAALGQRRRIALDRERHLRAVGELDVVDDGDVVERSLRRDLGDHRLE